MSRKGNEGVIQIGGGLWSRGSTIRHLASALTYDLGQPVQDETKITGNYDFRLRYDDKDADDKVSGAIAALHDLGLKLEARKLPIEMLVIESAERPSAN